MPPLLATSPMTSLKPAVCRRLCPHSARTSLRPASSGRPSPCQGTAPKSGNDDQVFNPGNPNQACSTIPSPVVSRSTCNTRHGIVFPYFRIQLPLLPSLSWNSQDLRQTYIHHPSSIQFNCLHTMGCLFAHVVLYPAAWSSQICLDGGNLDGDNAFGSSSCLQVADAGCNPTWPRMPWLGQGLQPRKPNLRIFWLRIVICQIKMDRFWKGWVISHKTGGRKKTLPDLAAALHDFGTGLLWNGAMQQLTGSWIWIGQATSLQNNKAQ